MTVPPCAGMADDGRAGAAGTGDGVTQGSTGTTRQRRAGITPREKECGQGGTGAGGSPGGRGGPGAVSGPDRPGVSGEGGGAERRHVGPTRGSPALPDPSGQDGVPGGSESSGAWSHVLTFSSLEHAGNWSLSTLPCAQAGFAVHAGSCSFAARAMTACALGHGPALDGAAQRAQWVLQAEPPGRLSAPGGAILAQGRDGGTLPEEEVKIKLLFSGGRLGMFHLEKGRLQRHPRALKGLQDSWRGTLDEGLE